MMPVVLGTPIAFGDGLKVIAPNLSGTDAMPLIDGQTAGILGAVNSFTIKQRIRWGEALTMGCIEQSNVYDIYDASNGNHIFVAVEVSEDSTRCCCAPHHSLQIHFKTTAGMGQVQGMPRDQLLGMPTTMTMERIGCCAKPCLGCFICSDSCKDGFALHAGPVDVPVGEAGPAYEKCIGHATQPGCGGTFTPTINIMDRGPGQGEFAALAKVEGPCLFGGCSELCFDSQWNVSKARPRPRCALSAQSRGPTQQIGGVALAAAGRRPALPSARAPCRGGGRPRDHREQSPAELPCSGRGR